MPVNHDAPMAWTNALVTARFRAAMEDRARQELAARLKQLREYKAWTADDLAHNSGVSPRSVSRLETASVENPRENTLKRLAAAFGITRDELAGPRLSPEAIDQATQTQLDRIENSIAKVQLLLEDAQRPIAEHVSSEPAGSQRLEPGELLRRIEDLVRRSA